MSPRDSQPTIVIAPPLDDAESAWLLIEETDELAPTPDELCDLIDAADVEEEEPSIDWWRDHYRAHVRGW